MNIQGLTPVKSSNANYTMPVNGQHNMTNPKKDKNMDQWSGNRPVLIHESFKNKKKI